MNRWKKYAAWIAGFGFLMIAGSLFHAPQWVAKAANIFSQPVSNVREAYRRPFQNTYVASGCGVTDGSCGTVIATDVPFGYQLVVDHVSVQVETGSNVTSMSGRLSNGNGNNVHYFPLTYGGDGGLNFKLFVATQSVHVTIPYNSTLFTVSVVGQTPGTNFAPGFFNIGVTGYLENCAAYPGGACPVPFD
jgi:hypothetical protein